ncbi:MAG: chlorohydrolase [Ignavibacteriales bacterium CG07_land_8_20_14_0_80_59_12]|nr:MAG: chlorohydrolase [Ignavibacteriales bacterium CG07_land_8_20_14_0_80_59_12]
MLLKNATLFQISPARVASADVRIVDGIIGKVGRNISAAGVEEVLDLAGKILMPGLVCAHTHLYSSLSRGMPGPKRAPRNFVEILKGIWWKLDRALDEEAIYYSALAGAIEAAKYGTTTIIDHHASPNCIGGSLHLIKKALQEVGLRGVLCYETTDRGGLGQRDDGLEENERFIAANRKNQQFKGLVGAHASFTLSEGTLAMLGTIMAKYGTGLHIHAAEDRADVRSTRGKFKLGITERLLNHGLLGRRTILAHGVHLAPDELEDVKDVGAWLVHNPRSNMNNRVGYAPLREFGLRCALGTDGFPADMFEEAKIGFFRNAESGQTVGVAGLAGLLHGGHLLASELFGREFGAVTRESVADFVVMDYRPPTPLTSLNAAGHFLFGMNSSMVESVMVEGKWVVRDRRLIGVDEERTMQEARKVAARLWKRMEKLH